MNICKHCFNPFSLSLPAREREIFIMCLLVQKSHLIEFSQEKERKKSHKIYIIFCDAFAIRRGERKKIYVCFHLSSGKLRDCWNNLKIYSFNYIMLCFQPMPTFLSFV